MPYPILRVSGAPTRVPVRAQRGPCSPRLLPLGLGLLLDFYRRPASEVSCPRSSKPQGAGDEGSRGRTFSGGAGSGPRCLGGKRAWRRFSPRSGLGRSVLIPMWRTGVGTRTGAVIGRRGGGRGSRPGRGRGEDMWVHADVVAGVVGATTSAVAPAGWPEDEAAGDIIECPDGCRVIGRGAWTGTDRPTIAAALFQALVRAGAALDRSQP